MSLDPWRKSNFLVSASGSDFKVIISAELGAKDPHQFAFLEKSISLSL